jgi:hypothetical protein
MSAAVPNTNHLRILTSKDKHIIQPPTKRSPTERRHHRNPKVIVPRRPNLVSIPKEVTHESGTKVSCKINRIASLPTKASTDAEDDEEQAQRRQVPCTDVAIILQRVDAEHENCASDEFREELAGLCHECCGVGAEDTA